MRRGRHDHRAYFVVKGTGGLQNQLHVSMHNLEHLQLVIGASKESKNQKF